MKSPRWSFFLILLAAITLFLAACEGDDKGTSGKNGEEPDIENNEETSEKTYDLGGRKITIASHFDMSPEEGTEMGDLQYERWKEVRSEERRVGKECRGGRAEVNRMKIEKTSRSGEDKNRCDNE